MPSAARSAAAATSEPEAIASSTADARTGVEPMFVSADPRRAVLPDRGDPDGRPVLRTAVELLVGPAGPVELGHADLGQDVLLPERRLEEALEEVGGGHRPFSARATDDELGVEREQDGR